MTDDPDAIRADIERTRENLSSDVNALADQVNPKNVARRQADKVVGAATGVKDKVMGSASDLSSSSGSAVSAAHDAASAAPQQVVGRTRGNPLAAGLIAFGAGLLVASLLPASEKERHAAAAVKDQAEPLKQEVTAVVKDAASNLQEPAKQAAADVKGSAAEAASAVKDEAATAAQGVQGDVQQAKESVQDNRS